MMQESNTLGGRIQAGRKAAGLSQEALGEQLEVSRQAVSKWESDGAIPELEKLIAMSRIFGVSVGVLLGVETEEAPEGGGTLTEGELAAVEAIAARYAAAGQGGRPWTRRRKWAVGVTAALLTALAVLLCVQLRTISRRFNQLQSQVNGMQSTVYIQPSAPAQDQLLLTYDLSIADMDVAAKTLSLQASAIPREQAAGAKAVFIAELSDGRRLSHDAVFDLGAFRADGWEIPMSDSIRISITLTEGETSRTGILETLRDCGPENARLSVTGGWTASYSSMGSSLTLGSVWLDISAQTELARLMKILPVSVEFCVYRNEKTTPEQCLPLENLSDLMVTEEFNYGMVSIVQYTGFETAVELRPGDTVVTAVRVRDSCGQTTYTVLGAWNKSESGQSIRDCWPSEDGDWTPGASLSA